MRRQITLGGAVVLLLAGLACKGQAPAPASAELKTEDEKTLYTLGALIGKNACAPLKLTAAEIELVKRGLEDAAAGKTLQAPLETYGPKVQAFAQARASAAGAAAAGPEKEKGKAFLEQAAKETGAVRTPTGLVIQVLSAGKGPKPGPTDQVKVHYRGTLIDGKEFDSSYKRGQPVDFGLQNVIPCWTEGVQLMNVGSKARLVCPSEIGYGDRGNPPVIPPGATLAFEVELLDILKK
jgi:FKBP-type peptidyl-prolyl cis-trans isomerase FkpA